MTLRIVIHTFSFPQARIPGQNTQVVVGAPPCRITSQQQSFQEAIRMNRALSTTEGKKVDGNINGVGMQGKQKSNRKCVYKGLGINQITRHASNHINSVVGGNGGVALGSDKQ